MQVNEKSVIAQSKNAYGQWKEKWRAHAKEHSRFAPFKSMDELMNSGVGRACLLVANGYTFEENLETIKANASNVDIMCCDKTIGHLLAHGIKPTYCLVADASVDFDKYLKPWKDMLDGTILLMNVCGNPQWSFNGNWKDRYFFVNQDVIHSELEFAQISGCQNLIPAATNVSNAMVVFLTQSDNRGRKNFFGYDKMLLIGYDYSWRMNGKYYAFDHDGGGKRFYMKHVYMMNKAGSLAYTSTNLLFSARWIEKYINSYRLPVVLCTKESILSIQFNGKLEEQMRYNFRKEDRELVHSESRRRQKLLAEIHEIELRVQRIGTEHHYNFMATV